MQKAKVLSYIGLATRARKSVSGEFSVENSVRKGKAKLVVVSEEASENTKKKIRSLCEYWHKSSYMSESHPCFHSTKCFPDNPLKQNYNKVLLQ